ncbi:hypothetical protein Y032_0078g1174 [Ancylostoma ceylanicum]|nr:hypothetical protein Y032_0078g1174 [Ancylostoma ceylanicum]
MRLLKLSVDDMFDQTKWRNRTRNADPRPWETGWEEEWKKKKKKKISRDEVGIDAQQVMVGKCRYTSCSSSQWWCWKQIRSSRLISVAILCLWTVVVLTLTWLLSTIVSALDHRKSSGHYPSSADGDNNTLRNTIWTAKGIVTYAEVEKNVFRPNNYKIVEPSFPFPMLDYISKPSCSQIFEEWLSVAKRPAPADPPKEIEHLDKNAFLLNGYSTLYEVYTVEYQDTKIVGTAKIERIHPIDFAEKWKENEEKFDFAITFSSIEHSGLGRYGDPIDPSGDLREVQKVMCLLKKGGLFLVGFPRGADAIKYNLHRIYGRMRLSMIMTGYELLAMYRGDSPYPQCPQRKDYETIDTHQQDLYVLRKP